VEEPPRRGGRPKPGPRAPAAPEGDPPPAPNRPAAGARAARLPEAAGRLVTAADSPTRFAPLLALTGDLLAVLFCAVIAMLYLSRRAVLGNRAGPLAIAIALAGTLMMNATIGQPVATDDWRVLALADGLLAAGLALSVWAASSLGPSFGLAAEARGLVTSRAYRRIRHPLYLGEGVAALGALVPVLSPTTVLVYAAFCLCQAARAVLEERVLAATFPEYAEHRRRTPALLPWPSSLRCRPAASDGRRRVRSAPMSRRERSD